MALTYETLCHKGNQLEKTLTYFSRALKNRSQILKRACPTFTPLELSSFLKMHFYSISSNLRKNTIINKQSRAAKISKQIAVSCKQTAVNCKQTAVNCTQTAVDSKQTAVN